MGYTVHGILQARILEWVAVPFSRGSSQPRDGTQVSRIAGRFFTHWATREALSCGYIITNEICVLMVGCYFRADHQDVCFSSQPKGSQDKPDFLPWSSRGCSFKNCPLNYVLKWVYSCQSHTIQIPYDSVKCRRPLHLIPRVLSELDEFASVKRKWRQCLAIYRDGRYTCL